MNKKLLLLSYLLCDTFAAIVTWAFFFIYRKYNVDSLLFIHFSESIFVDPNFFIGLIAYPFYWLLLHAFAGAYVNLYRKSRLKELGMTFLISLMGSLIFFFIFIIDDYVNTPYDYVKYFFFLFVFQFVLTYLPRVLITTTTINKIHNGKIVFKTLIIGNDQIALNTYNKVIAQNPSIDIIGYVSISDDGESAFASLLPCVGTIDELPDLIKKYNIEELIIAILNGKRKYIETIISLVGVNSNLMLKIIPQTQDYLLGTVKTSSVLHEPLISIYPERMPEWQQFLKRFFDILLSSLAIILLLPFYLMLMVGVKCSSKGPIFYLQERIGYRGKLFKIIKFRSMYVGAEKDSPQLSRKNDERITRFGLFLRKTHLDEIPQFFNVILGDMSLVGPRPERQFYIDQIVVKAPHYKLLQNIRPGITSWGQVKYGYAENVDQMVERLKWDILYLENMSLSMDLKILIYTFLIVFKGAGK